MNLEVRAVGDEDVDAIHEILMSPHVIAGSMRVPLGPVSGTRERLTPPRGVHQLAAVAEGRVVGFRHEGTRERFGYGAGEWMDAYLMGRLRDA